jgi:Arc/MetJ-type ribon-helix-helix transcriptional regulator
VTVPVTSRLDEDIVRALDQAVAAGVAESRSGAIVQAVAEWLDRHGEEAIVASYRKRYATPDPEHDALVAAMLRSSIEAATEEGLL